MPTGFNENKLNLRIPHSDPGEAVMAQKALSFFLRWDWRSWVASTSPEIAATSEAEFPSEEERRTAVRHPSGLGITCQPIALMRITPWPAVVQDISATGIGLVLDHPLPPGAFLALQLPIDGAMKPIRAQVVAARPQPDGGWVIGCTLARRLRPNELRSLT